MLTKLKDYVGISTTKQCQMMTSLVARVKFIKIKIVLGIIPKASQTKFHQIWITKPKVIHVQVPVPRWENEKMKKISGLQNGASRGLITNQSRFQGLQIGARRNTNRDSFRDFKSGQKDYKLGQGFQIGAKRFQIGAEITSRGRQKGFQFGAGIGNRFRTNFIMNSKPL